MKILIIATAPFFCDRGTPIRILGEVLALQHRGHTCIVATYHLGNDPSSEIGESLDIRRIPSLIFWHRRLETGPSLAKAFSDLVLLFYTLALTFRERPNILHAHNHEGAVIAWLIRRILFFRKMKGVADLHGAFTDEILLRPKKKNLLYLILQKIEKVIDQNTDAIVTSSGENAEFIRTLAPQTQIVVLPDGVTPTSIHQTQAELRQRFHLPQNKILIVYTGALHKSKGVPELLEVIQRVIQTSQQAFFVIGGYPIDEVERLLSRQGLLSSVRLISPLSFFTLPYLLKACDIAIDAKSGTTKQGSGKILQYMNTGLPVVCLDRPYNRTTLREGGILCSSPAQMSMALVSLLSNPQRRIEMGERNKVRSSSFSWDQSAQKLEHLYTSLCSHE